MLQTTKQEQEREGTKEGGFEMENGAQVGGQSKNMQRRKSAGKDVQQMNLQGS